MPRSDPLLTSVVCTLVQAADRPAPPADEVARRTPHYTLLLCRSGRVRAVVGQEAYLLSPGTVLLVAPDMPLLLDEPSERGLRVTEIIFDARLHGLLDMPALYGFPTLHRPTRASMEKIAQAARSTIRSGPASCVA